MKIFSLYSGYIHASTGVASVLIALDDGDWSGFSLEHRIFSLDNLGCKHRRVKNDIKKTNINNLTIFTSVKKGCFSKLSQIRQKIWKMAENSNILAIIYLTILHKFRAAKLVKKFLKENSSTNFIVVHDIWSLLALHAAKFDLKHVVFVIHGSEDPMSFILKIFPKLKGDKFLTDISDDFAKSIVQLKSVIVLSAQNKENISNKYSVKSTLILNGISSEGFYQQKNNDFILHITGSICTRKRQYLLIEALKALGVEFLKSNNVKVNLFGGGPDYNILVEKVICYGLSPWVILHGNTEKPYKSYKLGDLILCISTEEGLPVALIEGLRAGCVPVITDVGGCNLTVGNNNGFVLPSMTDDLVLHDLNSLLLQLTDKKNRELMGMKSIDLFNNQFSNQKMVEEYAKEILA